MMKIRAVLAKRQVVQLAVVTALLMLCTTAALYAYHRYLRNVRVALVGFRDSDWGLWFPPPKGPPTRCIASSGRNWFRRRWATITRS
jgi:hypothetical protein